MKTTNRIFVFGRTGFFGEKIVKKFHEKAGSERLVSIRAVRERVKVLFYRNAVFVPVDGSVY